MAKTGYKQFCPVAMASEVLCTRWTMVLLRELVAGTTRFNDLRRGVPKMSSALLSTRLKELEVAGIVERRLIPKSRGHYEYHLTEAGQDLRSVIEVVGFWGQKWIKSIPSLKNLDASLLMWDMRRNLKVEQFSGDQIVIEFYYSDLPSSKNRWWLIVEPNGEVDLCWSDPRFEIDLYVTTNLRTMTEIWMGLTTMKKESNKVELLGDATVARTMQSWLGLSPFATEKKIVQ